MVIPDPRGQGVTTRRSQQEKRTTWKGRGAGRAEREKERKPHGPASPWAPQPWDLSSEHLLGLLYPRAPSQAPSQGWNQGNKGSLPVLKGLHL